MMNSNVILNAVLLSLLAGLGTGLGGLIAIIRKPGKRSFGFLMGMTAGVMISAREEKRLSHRSPEDEDDGYLQFVAGDVRICCPSVGDSSGISR